MKLFSAGGPNYIGVRDIESTVSWYVEKFSVHKIDVEMDDREDCVALGYDQQDYLFTLGPLGKPTDQLTPQLFTAKLKKAWDFLNTRGVTIVAIQEDSQGTHYFEMRDLEGNTIEISEEP
jgi:catechol 2,3-dioxygenase-like lactoylglutathione lyase family enzyme